VSVILLDVTLVGAEGGVVSLRMLFYINPNDSPNQLQQLGCNLRITLPVSSIEIRVVNDVHAIDTH
jgi:hypothetical protein